MNRRYIFTLMAAIGCCGSLFAVDVIPADTAYIDYDEWALVNVPVACIRTDRGHASELSSQVVMGTPVRVTAVADGWRRILTPESYTGWVIDNSLCPKSADDISAWRKSPRWVVTSLDQAHIYSWPGASSPRQRVSELVNGSIVEGVKIDGMDFIEATLPDGRTGYLSVADVTPIEAWAGQDFDADKVLDLAYSMEGSPYLWGGTSTKSADCSGLTKIAYYSNGVLLRRDAGQQAVTGRRIEVADSVSLEAGDLLFFGNPSTQKVTHVAIYDRDGNYVHSSGRVKRNNIHPTHPAYLPNDFLWAVRVNGMDASCGIIKVIEHPWYFNIDNHE